MRTLLVVSFGGLLVLLAAAGAGTLAAAARLQQEEASQRERWLAAAHALERVRSGVLLSGVFARDYFLAPDTALLGQIAEARGGTIVALAAFEPPAPSLRGEVAAYWKVLDLMIEMANRAPAAGVDSFFRRQLAGRRETMLRIVSEIQAETRREQALAAASLADLRSRYQQLAIGVIALALAGGLALAILATRRLLSLEAKSADLSARLVSAQEQERREIARELHDGVGQSLSTLLLRASAPAGEIANMAREALDAVRELALSLRPSMLDDLGLAPALEWQAREVMRRSGLAVAVETHGDLSALSEDVYRIAQEALHNATRHGGAKKARVVVERGSEAVALCIEDDGRGFDTACVRGLGLLGMEERARNLRGAFHIESRQGSGTLVRVELPLCA